MAKRYWDGRARDSFKAVGCRSLPEDVLREANEEFVELARSFLSLEPYPRLNDCRLLDIGCGTGYLLWRLQDQCRLFGMDVSSEFVEISSNRNPSASFVVADAISLPFPSETFDVVIAKVTLQHLLAEEDRLAALHEIFRVTKPGGVVIIEESCGRLLGWLQRLRGSNHVRALPLSWYREHFSRTGFEIVRLLRRRRYALAQVVFMLCRKSIAIRPPSLLGRTLAHLMPAFLVFNVVFFLRKPAHSA